MNAAVCHPDSEPKILTVSRGMQLLRAFRADSAPLTNAELVRRTGFSKATVSRLTSTLLQLGFVRHPPGSREFVLAAGPLGIGHALIASSELPKAAGPFLQEVADRLGLSVALAAADGLDMLYVAYQASHCVSTLRMGVGSLVPMAATAIGHAYLWALPADERSGLLEQLKRAAGARAAVVTRCIEESFAALEATGTCGVLGAFQRNAYAIALPVRVGLQRRLMALSCGKAEVQPDLRSERKRIAPVLKDVAARLEAALAGIDSLS